MSAASPIWRGYLAEIDCRWNVLCAMSDDRTAEERGFEVNKNSGGGGGVLFNKKQRKWL